MARSWKQFYADVQKMSPAESEAFRQRIIHAYNFGPSEDLARLRQKAKTKKLTEDEQWLHDELSKYF